MSWSDSLLEQSLVEALDFFRQALDRLVLLAEFHGLLESIIVEFLMLALQVSNHG
jgi:hypothetical protein